MPHRADPTPEGEALYELMVQLPRLHALLRPRRLPEAPVLEAGSGLWILLRSLKLDGPRTVPQIARARGVARQRIQKLVDDANAAGFVRLRNNPDHVRSRVVMLTAEGAAAFEESDGEMRARAETLAANLDIRDLDSALRVMFELVEQLRRP